MGTTLARKIRGMSWWTKIGIVLMLLTGILVYQGVFRPEMLNSATNTYYFTTDSTSVNLGADGTTNTTSTLNGKYSMKTGVYTTSRSVTAAANLTAQTMVRVYGPVYGTMQTVTAPALTIGVRDRNGTANNINWWAEVYKYNPAGAANNGTLLWTSNTVEAHPSVQTPLELPFTNPQPKDVEAGYRLKIVIKCQLSNTASLARLYWGNSTNYSFFTVTEANYVANSLTVTNMGDYYNGQLTNVTQGDANVPMLKFDLYSNVVGGASWTGGKLDKIGTNTTVYLNPDEPGDVSFKIWKDTDNDGLFETSDTLVGGPYTYAQLTGQTYTLTTAQTITATPQRYFITYDILRTATPSTTVGARIANSTYFTVTGAAGGVQNVTSTSSSTPNIEYGGVAVSKVYKADWDAGTSLAGIAESGGPAVTDSTCITRTTAGSGFPLVGLLNYPAHSCTSVAGQGYSTTTAQSDFIRLYFGGAGYASAMKTIKGTSFTYRVYTPSGGGTVTLRLFYVTPGGVRVNAPIASTYTTTASVNQAVTTSLAGQDFSNVPQGSRLGIQVGVTANMRISLGSANGMTGSTAGANLTVQETAAENENVDVGNGVTIPNANVYASDTGKVLNAFTLNSAKPKTVSGITLTGNALFNSTNIKNVRLYADAGTIGVVDGETPLATLPGTSISGNSISFTGLSLNITPTVRRYLVTVDIGDTPNVNVIVKALVSGVTVVTTGTMGNNTDSASATLTIQPTTTLTDGAAEPPNAIINASGAATRVDAFGLRINGGINDQINTVTVTLSTVSALPAGHVVSDYVAKVEIVNSANTVVHGYLTSPTTGDNWQVSTTGLSATAATTECYVRITPKTNLGGTYVVKASVTDFTHLRTINRKATPDDDITSASITLDGAPPNEAGNFTAATASNAPAINLNWNPATDASGSSVTYTVVRGLGNAPVPKNCTPVGGKVFLVYQGADPNGNPDVYNNGLEEGQSYSYRICTTDSVGNRSTGVTAHTTAGIINRCSESPELIVNPSASYIKGGETKELTVAVVNKDTGTCGSASTFQLSVVGTPNTTDFDPVAFTANNFVLPTNGGSKYLKLRITAKAGAPQMAENHFSVRVNKTGASSATVQYPDPVHVVVNKYGTMMHSSMQLGTNKFGQWGTDYTCATCHDPNATNLKRVSNVIATPTGNRPVVFTTISASQAVTTGVMGNDLRAGTTSTNVCEVCHHRARFHQYSSSKVAWNTHNNSSDCMRCHDHRIGFKTLADGLSCTDCHGNPPAQKSQLVIPPTNVLYPYVIGDDAGAHPTHAARNVKCQACHNNANHLASAQPDTKLNMGFRVWSSTYPGFKNSTNTGIFKSVTPANDYAYEAAAGTDIQPAFDKIMTCSVYCHGYWNGSYTASGGYNTEVAWSGVTQTGCSSCHGAEGATPPPSGSHSKHAGTVQGYGNGIACAVCHGYRNYSSGKSHLNGSVEWDLSTTSPSAVYKGLNKGESGAMAPTNPASYGSCATLYCHSNVQSANGTAGPTSYATVTWGGTVTCGSCHTHSDFAGHNSGGHSQHTAPGVTGFDCRICHGSGGDANSLHHADKKIDFMFSGLGDNTTYSHGSTKTPGSAPFGTCSTSNCHGRTTITWGPSTATPLCDKCHTTNPTPAGFYATTGPGGTKSKTDLYVGAHFQHITSMPYKYSAKLDCSQCHVKPTGPYSPGHIDNALPAEINFGALAASGAQNGYSSASHQPSYVFGSKQCNNVWCHGAGMNSNEGTGPYGSAVDDGGTLGTPAAAVWNSPYLTGVGANDCVKCHSMPPAAPKSGYEHFDDDTGAPYALNKCTNCHRHLNANATGFTNPSLHVNGMIDSCNNCHGRPPIDNSTLTKPVIGALSDGMVGAHQAHRLNPAIGNDCGACHYNYAYDMPSYKLEIGFRAYGNRVTKGVFWGMTTLPSVGYSQPIVYFSTWTSTKVRRTSDTTKINTCESVYCHGGGTKTLAVLGGGTNVKPNWEGGPSQATCGTCHGVSGETYRTRGSHGAHVGTGFGEPRLACNNCHGVKENNYHVDGKVEWEFYSTAKRLNQLPGYSGAGYKPSGGSSFAASGFVNNLAPSASWGTCQVYCHSDGKGTYASPAPVWGGAAMNCGSCHKNQTSVGQFTGSHQKHSASSANGGYAIECSICHLGSGSGNPLHVNGTFDIAFNTTVVGVSATWNSGTKQCFNILCHDSTVATGPTWNVPATGNYDTGTYKPTCIGCHSGEVGGRTAVAPQFAGESHHIQKVAMSNSYCYPCHMEASNSAGVVNATYHDRTANKPVDLVIWGAGSRGAVFTKYTAAGSTTPARKRAEYAKINNHCLGCHSTKNDATQPFSATGDTRTPKAYAWDDRSIFNRYSSIATTPWGKVTGNNTVTKTLNKAYSAHGSATTNQRGWAVGNGTSGETYSDTAAGTVNVLCYDCHNSHGTTATGVMSSYSSATGRYKGGILKTTVEGVGGYNATYAPVAGGNSAAPDKNVYNPGAALCFDCHNTRTSSTTVPWGYNSTFGATQAIYGYHDKPYFGNYSAFANTRTYAYKNNNPDNKGGHFGPSTALTTAITQRTFANGIKDKAYSAGVSSPVNGLCTPCHDPHGVTKNTTYVSNRQYGVPLLKGTWVTSPYKQDAAPAATNETRGGGRQKPALSVGSTPGYRIDQNTMGVAGAWPDRANWTWPGTPTTLQPRTDAEFAGLCVGCHAKANINNAAAASSSNWKTVGRVHNTVRGWATATGGNANNAVHAFTCSKCHAPHNTRLPRLLVTNCLDAKHRGRVASGGHTANAGTSAAAGNFQSSGSSGAGVGRFPQGGGGTGSRPLATAGKWFFGKGVESTSIATESNTQCHNSATAGGATFNSYTTQFWNRKSPW
ncbi:MAG: CxxxxCH/CxxCH domain-containing protein [Desulfuromonadales bacterium]|nr:MAG: CxxxxCH/CxxCH domain-containing protein [Desulfuromonadales bacterium]